MIEKEFKINYEGNKDTFSYTKRSVHLESLDKDRFILWYEKFSDKNIDNILCKEYKNVFIAKTESGEILKIGSLGFFTGFKVFVSKKAIIARIYSFDKVIDEKKITSKDEYTHVPYDEIFMICASMKKLLKSCLNKEYYDIPFVGGCKSITSKDEIQEVAVFYIPEIILYGNSEEYTLFHTTKDCFVDDINFDFKTNKAKSEQVEIHCNPQKEHYINNINSVIQKLKEDQLTKVVISRKYILKLKEPVDFISYAQHIFNKYFQEYYYMFEFANEEKWIGISPEIILKKNKEQAITKPLAGTRKKGHGQRDNEIMIQELIHDSKENLEHESALNFMIEDLEKSNVGQVILGNKKDIIETPYVYHLKSEIKVLLNQNVTCFDLLSAIYPPATIWGIPRKISEKLISQIEKFERSYFTGIYGFFDLNGNADFALVIRSAMIKNNEINIFAGSGIVKSANAEYEWDETKIKMNPFIEYFK